MARKRVLITGAAGYLSRQLLPVFRERYDLVLLDRRKPHDIDDIIEVDLVNPEIDTYRKHFKGVDAIVHNTRSTRPDVNTGAPRQWLKDRPLGDLEGYYVERASLDMAYHVFRLAQEEGITRVVTASSNHATDWYETKLHDGRMDCCDHTTYPLSDNFYGWAKIAYENLGFIFATGRFGRPVENIHIRIVVPRPVDGAKLHVLGSGDVAFQKIVDRVKHAERSVEIRAFLWRDDEAGNQMGEAVLAAALLRSTSSRSVAYAPPSSNPSATQKSWTCFGAWQRRASPRIRLHKA